jgi:trimethylamine--corrinoid protein Co-methyltransferase
MNGQQRHREVLTEDEVGDIHGASLRVLEEIGLWLPNREILERLHDGGGNVDFETMIARMPGDLVERCIREIPAGFIWPARNPANTLQINNSSTHFQAPDSAIHIVDLAGNRRLGTAKDGQDICRLCDALPNLSVIATGVHPHDLPGTALDAWFTMTCFTHSSKPVFAVSRSESSSHLILRMAEVVADICNLPEGKLPLMAVSNTVSPLYNTPHQLEGMLVYIKRGVPLMISPEVQSGATGPATLAGTLVQATAEFLGHATVTQLFTPGMPLMYGCVSSVFDMRTMILPYGAPEADLLCMATAQMARHYGIPSRGTGGSSDANAVGMQAGVESLMSTLACIEAGVSFVAHGAGELQNTLAVSFEKTVIDDEIIGMARRLAKGIDVTTETLAFDVIKNVGPRGHFLTEDHTLHHFRDEQFIPNLVVRDRYDNWKARGAKRMEERARDRVRKILSTHEPLALPEKIAEELQAIYGSSLVSS